MIFYETKKKQYINLEKVELMESVVMDGCEKCHIVFQSGRSLWLSDSEAKDFISWLSAMIGFWGKNL